MTSTSILVSLFICTAFALGFGFGYFKGVQRGASLTSAIASASFFIAAEVTYGIEWYSDFMGEMLSVMDVEKDRIRKMALAMDEDGGTEAILRIIRGDGEELE